MSSVVPVVPFHVVLCCMALCRPARVGVGFFVLCCALLFGAVLCYLVSCSVQNTIKCHKKKTGCSKARQGQGNLRACVMKFPWGRPENRQQLTTQEATARAIHFRLVQQHPWVPCMLIISMLMCRYLFGMML